MSRLPTVRKRSLQQPGRDSNAPRDPELTIRRTHVNGNRRWEGVKDLDPQEEEYFNAEDDEDEATAAAISPTLPPTPPIGNGSSSPYLTSLVDYPADEEETGDALLMDTKERDGATSSSPPSGITTPPSSEDVAVKPPERLAEKRRRAEEDDDELGKLSSASKRRSGSAGAVPVGSQEGKSTVLRRKKSFTLGNAKDATAHATAPGKKIAISLAVKKSTPVDEINDKRRAEEAAKDGS
jgi:protein phosphatase-4 regulatory subunit 3